MPPAKRGADGSIRIVMNLFLPDSGLVVWMLLAFTIVFVVLAKFGWPTILQSLNNREKYITDSLQKANEAVQTLAGLEQKGKDIIASAQAEQMRMVKETQAMNEKMIQEAKQQAQVEADKIIASAQEQIRKDKEKALQDIRKEVVSLSIGMAEKVLRKELSDTKSQSDYVERLLNDSSLS